MGIISTLLSGVILLIGKVLPAFNLDDSFYTNVNTAIVTIVNIITSAAYFVPLDILVSCLTVMLVVDNFAIVTRLGAFVLKLVRG